MPFGLKSKKPAKKVVAKKVIKSATKTGTKSKSSKELTPIQKAQLARKKGGTGAKRPRKPTIDFFPPADFKPFAVDIKFKTGKDGLLMPDFQVERIRGRWNNEDAKRWDMMEYDAATVTALMSRLGGLMFAPNVVKRLPANTGYRIILRVALRKVSADSDKKKLGVSIAAIARYIKSKKTGKMKATWLTDAKDADRRRLRRSAKHLAGAFTKVMLPPSGRRSKKETEED